MFPHSTSHRVRRSPLHALTTIVGPAGLLLAGLTLATAAEFTSVDIGDPAPKAGTTTVVTPGKDFDVIGYGRMFANHLGSDEGRFIYTKVAGDFDLSVQVAGVESSVAAYAEAGLMARASLDPKSRLAAQFVTCNNYKHGADQYAFDFRLQEGGSLTPSAKRFIFDFFGPGVHGNPTMAYAGRKWSEENSQHPRPFPNVWIRLRRVGHTYSGYWRDGHEFWHKVTECTLDLGPEVYVGLCLSANHHDPEVYGKWGDGANASTASFRDLQWLPATELTQP